MREFETALGLEPRRDLPKRSLQLTCFSSVDRWSHEGILQRGMGLDSATEFQMVRLDEVVYDLENGSSPRCHDEAAGTAEWGVLKLGAVSFGTFNDLQNKRLPSGLKPRSRLEVLEGDVLISRANILRLVGACAFVHKTDRRFLAEVMKVGMVREQIEREATGTSPTMKNISKPALMSLTFPLPPMERQLSLVKEIEARRSSAQKQRREARLSRDTAWSDFRNAVFS